MLKRKNGDATPLLSLNSGVDGKSVKNFVFYYFPILTWLPLYNAEKLRGDLSAGFTVGVLMIPQGMALALLSGVPPIYGLYTAFFPQLIYALTCSSRQLSLGPVAVLAVLTGETVVLFADTPDEAVPYALVLSLLTGTIILILGVLKLDFLENVLSEPVVDGFISGAVFVVLSSQLANATAIPLESHNIPLAKFSEFFLKLGEADASTLYMSVCSVGFLLGMKTLKKNFNVFVLKVIPEIIILVCVAIGATWYYEIPVEVVGEIPNGLPKPTLPQDIFYKSSILLPAALSMVILCIIQAVNVGQMFAAKHRYTLDVRNEFIAIGASNFAGSFFGGLPVGASLSRCSVNDIAGAQTPFSAFFASSIVGMALIFLDPILFHMPKCVMASIIIVAVVTMFHVKEVKFLFKIQDKKDMVLFWVSFLCTFLLGVEDGIFISISICLVLVLKSGTTTSVAKYRRVGIAADHDTTVPIEIIELEIKEGKFNFINAKSVFQRVRENCDVAYMILNILDVVEIDSTGVKIIVGMVDYCHQFGCKVVLVATNPEIVAVIKKTEVEQKIFGGKFFSNAVEPISLITEEHDEVRFFRQSKQSTSDFTDLDVEK